MRFYTKKHRYYCGIDLHARSMYICILGDEERPLLHRSRKVLDQTRPSRIIREHLTRPAPEKTKLWCDSPVA
jgi:hypothetical protein